MDEFEKYYIKTAHFLSYRPRSIKEVRENLQKKQVSSELIKKLIELFQEQKFLNDLDFARWWVRQRTVYRPKSKRVIGFELMQKGVSKEIIEQVVSEKTDESKTDPTLAREIVQKKIAKYKDLPRQKIYEKLGAFLARRGFSWDDIKHAIDTELDEKRNPS